MEIQKGDEYDAFEPWVGRGLIFRLVEGDLQYPTVVHLSGGKKWHKRRKMLVPAFTPSLMDNYIKTMHKHAKVRDTLFISRGLSLYLTSERLCGMKRLQYPLVHSVRFLTQVLQEVLAEKVGKEFDFFPYSKRCALDIICGEHTVDPWVRSIRVTVVHPVRFLICRHCNGQGSGRSTHPGSAIRSIYRSPHEVGNGGKESDSSNRWDTVGEYWICPFEVPFKPHLWFKIGRCDWLEIGLKIKDQLWDIWLDGSRSMMRMSSPHTLLPIRYGNQGDTVDSISGKFGISFGSWQNGVNVGAASA